MQIIPRTFQNFSTYLRLPDSLTRRWWEALSRSTWTESRALRQSFLLRDVVVFTGQADGIASPLNMTKALENLVRERCLTRDQANALESYILACTTKAGRWMSRPEMLPHAQATTASAS